MKIAKKIQKLLDRREKLAVDLMNGWKNMGQILRIQNWQTAQ